ncbi:MAG: hypothetical protein A3J74_10550 [Elusimicrobia bacterium RIFCSPHIGHO2_02_FULL_57_9]|nr:MAG: hypothetical protein A3J74_10550 [Elusimicrobia bacterium RIFCSPHIGHO2_02_FULL_57_9]
MSGGSLLALGMALLAVLPCLGRAPDFEREPQKVERRALLQFPNGKKIKVDVVDTPESRASGLMFRKKLAPDYGMLFVFPTETSLSFWMKNTGTSLDIIFIGRDKMITRLYPRVRPSTPHTAEESIARVKGWGQYVLELPAGAAVRQGVKEGQILKFDVPIPQR